MTNTLVPSGGTAIEITDEQQVDDVHRVITLNMGPQHPSTHGVFRVVLDLEGEIILDARPVMGYLHRGVEKLFENHRYPQLVPWTDRTDYAAAPSNNLAICMAIEQICGIEVPERAEYFRVILAELSRIASHLIWVGTHALDMGALSMVLYAFREREMILDLFDSFCGARLTTNIMEIGGFTRDIPDGWIEKCREFVAIFPSRQQEYVDLLSANPIWLNRTKGIGVITAEEAIAYSLTGPMIRGSGVAYDIRKAKPYLVYDRLDWEVPIGENGDTYDRYLVRMEEMRQSLSMIEQCLDQMPSDGPFLARESNYVQPPHLASQYNAEDMQRHFVWTIKGPRPPKGEIYCATEGPKGEIGFYLISDGSPVPYRLHYRAPSFVNLQILPKLARGAMLADVVALIGTIDIVLGDVDRWVSAWESWVVSGSWFVPAHDSRLTTHDPLRGDMPTKAPNKLITATINGKQIQVPEGTLAIEAARMHGFDIPNFCYEPSLRPWGSCRMCMVEVQGRRPYVTEGCSLPLREGTEISTHSPACVQARQDMMRFFLIDHALDCPVCDKSGECKMQDFTYEYNVYNNPFRRPKRAEETRHYSPLIAYKLDRCVVCAQCVRVCDELVGATAITMAERGYNSEVVPAFGNSLLDTNCTHCGNCVAVCPVGALLDRNYSDHEWKLDHTVTTCHYCAVGCTIDARTISGELKRMDGVMYEGVNQGYLCVKGRWAYDYAQSADRLKQPLIRRGNRYDAVSWDEALGYIAMRLGEFRDGSFYGLGSTVATNEEAYLFQLFSRVVMGSNNLDTTARYSQAPWQRAFTQSFGIAATTNEIAEIRKMKCLMVIGANAPETHAITSYWMNLAVKTHGDPAHLIVIDPHWNLLCKVANVWLRPKPGTDGVLLNGMARYIIDEGLANEAFLGERAEGYAEWQASLADFTLERVSRVTGVPADDIRTAARLYATGGGRKEGDGWGPSGAFFGNGLTQHLGGRDNVLALNNLAILTGNVGREFAGVNTFVGDANTQGSGDMGVAPDRLPGGAGLADTEARARFEELWLSRWTPGARGVDGTAPGALPSAAGIALTELPAALEAGKVRALWIQGEDLIGAAPNPERVEQALERAEFLVVQAMFRTPTAELADVILPMVSGFEKDGTYTNLERRVQRVRKAIPPVAGGKPDWQLFIDLMRRFGYDLPYRHPGQIMDEIATMVPDYAGISYRRIEKEGLHWPVPAADHPGTPTLYLDGFATPSGKAQLLPTRYVLPSESADEGYPLIMQVGASLYHWGTGDRTRRSVGPRLLEPDPIVEIGVEDAAQAGLQDGDLVRVASRRGAVELRARVTDRLPTGNIRLFPHWPSAPVGRLVGEGTEGNAGAPELKHVAVSVTKIDAVEQAAD